MAEIAEQEFNMMIRGVKELAKVSLRVAEGLAERSEEAMDRIMNSSDPIIACQAEIDKAYNNAMTSLDQSKTMGAVSDQEYTNYKTQLDRLTEYDSVEDCSNKVASMEVFDDGLKEANLDYFKTGDKDAFDAVMKDNKNALDYPSAMKNDMVKESWGNKMNTTITNAKIKSNLENSSKLASKNISKNIVKNVAHSLIGRGDSDERVR